MPVTYAAALKTSRLTAVRDAIDAGSGPGTLEIGTAGMAAVLVTFTLNDPSATISGDVLTLSGLPKSATASGTGTAAAARFRDSTGTNVVTGLTVGTSAADVIISPTTSITSGQTVDLTAATITHG